MSTLLADLELALPRFTLKVNLDLPSRGVTAVFGPSGSGKTTLLRALCGLSRPRGHLCVNGETWQDDAKKTWLPPHLRPVGYVFQDAALFPHLSVRGNVEYGQKRVPAAERRVALERAIDLLAIGALMDRMTGQLSGGERQRVAIARALATSPRLLLMDEPLAGLDHRLKREILPYLEKLHAELDLPVLYVSHAPDEVARLADHLVVMDRGQVTASGSLTEVLSRIDLPIQLGEDAGVVLEAQVAERDSQWHLARMAFAGGDLWVRDGGLPLGTKARVRVLARDVSLSLEALEAQTDTSILNSLSAVVEAVADDDHPALLRVKLRLGPSVLLARVTKRSAHALGLAPGQCLHAQIKAAAVVG